MMAGRGSRSAQRTRASSERARLYAARTSWHEGQISRRVRDNTAAMIIGALIVIGAVVSQSIHAVVTAPEPAPTDAPTTGPVENPFADLFTTAPAD